MKFELEKRGGGSANTSIEAEIFQLPVKPIVDVQKLVEKYVLTEYR